MNLKYIPLEKIEVRRPTNRIKYIKKACIGKNVLDLGCFDETALSKKTSGNWLFEEISSVSNKHIGIDNSILIPKDGIVYGENEKIIPGDIMSYDYSVFQNDMPDVIIAGELVEHLSDTLEFFKYLKKNFPNKRLICTTPNSTSITNIILALGKRESCHKEHLQIYSFKTLNTLCMMSGFKNWDIIPYQVKYTEMILNSGFVKKNIARASQNIINTVEYLFPLMSGGLILDIEI